MIGPAKFKELPELPIVRWAAPAKPLATTRDKVSEPIVWRPLRVGESIAFGTCGNADRYLFGDDCHVAETDFRWAKRMVCRLAFNALFEGAVTLMVRLQIMVERPLSELQLAVTLNGERLEIRRCTEQPDIIETSIQKPLKTPTVMNNLIFYSRVVIVSEIIGGSDMRSIGVGLKDLRFVRND